ncbi:MAG: GGDEF domain-containing protein [Candidatus Hydrogenedentota bacterium]|nr:MAG: GGDEF domain-containing protein [Candidatus Hydrogenedentota bacterium]
MRILGAAMSAILLGLLLQGGGEYLLEGYFVMGIGGGLLIIWPFSDEEKRFDFGKIVLVVCVSVALFFMGGGYFGKDLLAFLIPLVMIEFVTDRFLRQSDRRSEEIWRKFRRRKQVLEEQIRREEERINELMETMRNLTRTYDTIKTLSESLDQRETLSRLGRILHSEFAVLDACVILKNSDTREEEVWYLGYGEVKKRRRGEFRGEKGGGIVYRIPLRSEGGRIGEIYIRTKTVEKREILEAIGEQAGMALTRAVLYQKVAHEARTDALTGLLNHKSILEYVEEEMTRARATGEEFSFMMADIDHFKRFNDIYGHEAGDAVLIAVARTLTHGLRASDRVGRWGGEEFAVLFPETPASGAAVYAERFRRNVEAKKIHFSQYEKPLSVTISVGVAGYPEHATTVEELINAADAALYTAKRKGRNQIQKAQGKKQ